MSDPLVTLDLWEWLRQEPVISAPVTTQNRRRYDRERAEWLERGPFVVRQALRAALATPATPRIDVERLTRALEDHDRRKRGDPDGCIAIRLVDLPAIAKAYEADVP